MSEKMVGERSGVPAGPGRRGAKPGRTGGRSELPMVTALLVMAVVVAMVAAGGPVIDMLSGFGSTAGR